MFRDSIGSVRGFSMRFASQSVQFGALPTASIIRAALWGFGQLFPFSEFFDYPGQSLIQSAKYLLSWFRIGRYQCPPQKEPQDTRFSSRLRARFASHLVQLGGLERVSRVNWFRSGLQSAFRESINSVRGFRARFAIHLVQFEASERVSRVNWFSSGLKSAFRDSIGSVRGFSMRFASQSVQFGALPTASIIRAALWGFGQLFPFSEFFDYPGQSLIQSAKYLLSWFRIGRYQCPPRKEPQDTRLATSPTRHRIAGCEHSVRAVRFPETQVSIVSIALRDQLIHNILVWRAVQRKSLTRQGSKAGKIRVRTGRESDRLR